MPREWNTPFREPWNPIIHKLLQTIDLHTQFYVRTKDPYHLQAAETLREYVRNLKTWIHREEGKNV